MMKWPECGIKGIYVQAYLGYDRVTNRTSNIVKVDVHSIGTTFLQ